MNIESLLNKANLFEHLVIDSGFKRDMTDYFSSTQQSQNQNLVYMKDLSEKIKKYLINFENNSLDNELSYLLKDTTPFTSEDIISELNEIDFNTEIEASEYYQKFHQILNKLINHISANESEIISLQELLKKYSNVDDEEFVDEGNALISIIFKDLQTTGTIKEFTKSLNKWNRALILYYTLLKSDSPEEIELVEIQNGSIDVICNVDLNISLDLTKVIITGLKVYGAYLLYKSKTAKEIIASYMGNKKLIASEKEREKLMFSNIYDVIKDKISEQHKENLKIDKKINKEGVDKKIEEVTKVITEHIIKGNEVKLLTYDTNKKDSDKDESTEDLADKLRENTSVVKERYNLLENADKQLLIETYTIKDEDE